VILALDPSSTRTGYAVLCGDGIVEEAGLMRPSKSTAPVFERSVSMGHQAMDVARERSVATVVVESPAPQQGQGRAYKGQASYGFGAGIITGMLLSAGCTVYTVRADKWTRQKPKEQRAAELEARLSSYDRSQDPGRDVADAIGLGTWWLRERRLEKERQK